MLRNGPRLFNLCPYHAVVSALYCLQLRRREKGGRRSKWRGYGSGGRGRCWCRRLPFCNPFLYFIESSPSANFIEGILKAIEGLFISFLLFYLFNNVILSGFFNFGLFNRFDLFNGFDLFFLRNGWGSGRRNFRLRYGNRHESHRKARGSNFNKGGPGIEASKQDESE